MHKQIGGSKGRRDSTRGKQTTKHTCSLIVLWDSAEKRASWTPLKEDFFSDDRNLTKAHIWTTARESLTGIKLKGFVAPTLSLRLPFRSTSRSASSYRLVFLGVNGNPFYLFFFTRKKSVVFLPILSTPGRYCLDNILVERVAWKNINTKKYIPYLFEA